MTLKQFIEKAFEKMAQEVRNAKPETGLD